MNDAINPKHYKSHPSGIECIQIRRHLKSNRSDAIKYLWRCGQKDAQIQELNKAIWYLRDEIVEFGGDVEYTLHTARLLDNLLLKLALHQEDDTRRVFNFIVFGGAECLQQAIDIIKNMIRELGQ